MCPAAAVESEYSVKAAFLLNFARFTQWPASAFQNTQSPFSICVLGEDSFGPALDQLVEGESVLGRRVVVQRLRKPPATKACHLLFVGASEKEARRVLAGVGGAVLTVGESPEFLSDGGIIAFVLESRRVRFDVSLSAAAQAGLTISSRMLTVARSVRK